MHNKGRKLMNKLKGKIKEILLNIIQELIKEKLNIIVGIALFLIITYFKDSLIIILNYSIPIWMFVIFIGIIILLYLAFLFIKRYHESKSFHKITKYGLEWHVNIKKNKLNSIKGPFCYRCQYELSESSSFQCQICKTDYTTKIENGIENLKNTVSKTIEAELRGGKMLILDWDLLYYPNSIFTIRNNGVSSMDNVKIETNLNISNVNKVIGSYLYDEINPDEEIKINNPNPMMDIHNILKDLKLVDIKNEIVDLDVVEDERGIHEEPIVVKWIEAKKNFSCQIEVNIRYSLRNKTNIENGKYILKFYILPPWNYAAYQDNCEIDFHKI